MKLLYFKFFIVFALLCVQDCFFGFAQQKSEYSHLTIEAFSGYNLESTPYTPGYYSSDPSKQFALPIVGHFELGVRYMFSKYFGVRPSLLYNVFKPTSGSPDYKSEQYMFQVEAVCNVGRIFRIEELSERMNILFHTGLSLGVQSPKTGIYANQNDFLGGALFGFTPQLKLSNQWVARIDYSQTFYFRQHLTFDGQSKDTRLNLSGRSSSIALGLSYILDTKRKHIDWMTMQDECHDLLMEAEEQLKLDSDGDGVPNYRDKEKNTPKGSFVDSFGRRKVE
jgi:OOP family OmpA-OmpF porin